eukprot:765090-Hanusia_phi.AAC.1
MVGICEGKGKLVGDGDGDGDGEDEHDDSKSRWSLCCIALMAAEQGFFRFLIEGGSFTSSFFLKLTVFSLKLPRYPALVTPIREVGKGDSRTVPYSPRAGILATHPTPPPELSRVLLLSLDWYPEILLVRTRVAISRSSRGRNATFDTSLSQLARTAVSCRPTLIRGYNRVLLRRSNEP